jgi:hypothetical protein
MSYFNYERKLLAIQDMKTILTAAQEVGIDKYLFVSFGLLLGICREKDFIGHDNDIDMCLLADKITKEQEDAYYAKLTAAGMFQAREEVTRRKDNNRITWFSLRKRANRSKFCHWFCFEWNGYLWHTKSGRWVKHTKFGRDALYFGMNDEAVMQGTPIGYIEPLQQIQFKDMKIRIPAMPGSVLDWCYPGWYMPKPSGSSVHRAICRVPQWATKAGWSIHVSTP